MRYIKLFETFVETQEVSDIIEKAKVEIQHAKKSNDAKKAKEVAMNLMNKLDELGYEWRKDASAADLIGEYA